MTVLCKTTGTLRTHEYDGDGEGSSSVYKPVTLSSDVKQRKQRSQHNSRLQSSRFRKAGSAVSVILERLSPFSLAVFSLAPDLSFEYGLSLAFAKNTAVLQSNIIDPNPNNSYKAKKKFTGSYTAVNPRRGRRLLKNVFPFYFRISLYFIRNYPVCLSVLKPPLRNMLGLRSVPNRNTTE